MPSNEESHSRAILMVATLIVVAAWIGATTTNDPSIAVLFDNVHWTVSATACAWLAIRGFALRDAPANHRFPTLYFTLAVASLAIGELVYDAEVFTGWLPFPSPSDGFFLAMGPLYVLGFAGVMRTHLPKARQRLAIMDVGGFTLAILALTLTLYLPRARDTSAFQLAVFAAYPVVLLAAATAGTVTQLHLRQRWNAPTYALVFGLFGQGAMWMAWNLQTLNGTLSSGSLTNLGFSIDNLILGWGLAAWRLNPDTSPGFDRFCEGLLRLLPLAMVALTTAAIGWLAFDRSLSDVTRMALFGIGLVVLLFAVLRQTQQLGERDRLIEAERVVADSQAKLQHLAHHDPLTDLPNLTLLRDRLTQAIFLAERNHVRTALLFIDLDNFKEVNDTLGHETGDALLCHVARQLEGALRATDTVCRQGGDEFTIVLPDIRDVSDVANVGEKLLAISRSYVELNGNELSMSMSIGIALYPDDAQDFSSLMRCADTAMYRAKGAGRSAYRLYDPTMNAEAGQRIRLRSGLSRALERGELHLHFQPQIDIASGDISGAEVLLRWDSAELGSIPPGEFIPVAEDSGLIIDIGAWVLLTACQRAESWRREGIFTKRIAVNVSILQFRRGNLEHQVTEALRISGLPPGMLELEVTESVLMQDQDRVIGTVERLTDLGVRISIDDFGTGYSSLSYLLRMRVGVLKIDKSFVQSALGHSGGSAVVRAIIEMAREIGAITIAEGVETQEQLGFLKQCKCNGAQGYLIARPMPAPDFGKFLAVRTASRKHQWSGIAENI